MSDTSHLHKKIKQLENQNVKFKKLLNCTLEITNEDESGMIKLKEESDKLRRTVSELESQKFLLENELKAIIGDHAESDTNNDSNMEMKLKIEELENENLKMNQKLNEVLKSIKQESSELEELREESAYLKIVLSKLEEEKHLMLQQLNVLKNLSDNNPVDISRKSLIIQEKISKIESEEATITKTLKSIHELNFPALQETSFEKLTESAVKETIEMTAKLENKISSLEKLKNTIEEEESKLAAMGNEESVSQTLIRELEEKKQKLLIELRAALEMSTKQVNILSQYSTDVELKRLVNELEVQKIILNINLRYLEEFTHGFEEDMADEDSFGSTLKCNEEQHAVQEEQHQEHEEQFKRQEERYQEQEQEQELKEQYEDHEKQEDQGKQEVQDEKEMQYVEDHLNNEDEQKYTQDKNENNIDDVYASNSYTVNFVNVSKIPNENNAAHIDHNFCKPKQANIIEESFEENMNNITNELHDNVEASENDKNVDEVVYLNNNCNLHSGTSSSIINYSFISTASIDKYEFSNNAQETVIYQSVREENPSTIIPPELIKESKSDHCIHPVIEDNNESDMKTIASLQGTLEMYVTKEEEIQNPSQVIKTMDECVSNMFRNQEVDMQTSKASVMSRIDQTSSENYSSIEFDDESDSEEFIEELPTVLEEEENDEDIQNSMADKSSEIMQQLSSVANVASHTFVDWQAIYQQALIQQMSSQNIQLSGRNYDDATNQLFPDPESRIEQRIRELEEQNIRLQREMLIVMEQIRKDKLEIENIVRETDKNLQK